MTVKFGNEGYVNPSLGRIGTMYFDERNNRIKFFSTEIHNTSDSIDSLVRQGSSMTEEHGATRLNARFLSRTDYKSNVEARIAFNNGLSGIELIFVGVNHPERNDSAETITAEQELVSTVLSTEGRMNMKKENIEERYQIERLGASTLTEKDVSSMKNLYGEAFTTYTSILDEDSIRSMVDNSIAYAVRDRKTGEIVSTSVAEIGTVQTTEGNLRICELSEMATMREYRGQGLVTEATKRLVRDIRDQVDLIYAEARACHRAINQSFRNMGFYYAGMLQKQCILSGDCDIAEKSPYENLNVWYVLPNQHTE